MYLLYILYLLITLCRRCPCLLLAPRRVLAGRLALVELVPVQVEVHAPAPRAAARLAALGARVAGVHVALGLGQAVLRSGSHIDIIYN